MERVYNADEEKLVYHLLGTHAHECVLENIDARHKVIQVARDEHTVFILPQYFYQGKWYCYTQDFGTLVYWKRVSSGLYQKQSAINHILEHTKLCDYWKR